MLEHEASKISTHPQRAAEKLLPETFWSDWKRKVTPIFNVKTYPYVLVLMQYRCKSLIQEVLIAQKAAIALFNSLEVLPTSWFSNID